jgi:hypothetical protein
VVVGFGGTAPTSSLTVVGAEVLLGAVAVTALDGAPDWVDSGDWYLYSAMALTCWPGRRWPDSEPRKTASPKL